MPRSGKLERSEQRGVDAVCNNLTYIRDEARKRYDAGLSARGALPGTAGS